MSSSLNAALNDSSAEKTDLIQRQTPAARTSAWNTPANIDECSGLQYDGHRKDCVFHCNYGYRTSPNSCRLSCKFPASLTDAHSLAITARSSVY